MGLTWAWDRCTYTDTKEGRERRCCKANGHTSENHLMATIVTLGDVDGLAEEATT